LFPEAPSYNRRVSDLLRAANEPVVLTRDSFFSTSTGMATSDDQHSSVEGAVLGVARATSFSAHAKALFTYGPSLVAESQRVTPSYVVPSPSASVGPSENSLRLARSIVTSVAPRTSPDITEREEVLGKARNLSPHFGSLPRPPATQTPAGAFPESVNSGLPYDDREDEISLQQFQSRDTPHSAVPLNQSAPFESYFPGGGAPSAYRQSKHAETFNPDLSRFQSKSRRSSVLTTISRASSRAARALSWFRKKPLPSLPPSPTRDKHEKTLPNPDDDMSAPDLALRAAVLDQYLEVGELPYNSPSTSPLPLGQQDVRRPSAPRRSMQSVLGSLRERRTTPVRSSQIPAGKLEDREARVGNRRSFFASRRRKIWCFAFLWCSLVIAVPIGVVFGRRALRNTSDCGDGLTGASCQLSELNPFLHSRSTLILYSQTRPASVRPQSRGDVIQSHSR
jgi:hypothetical protein